MKIEEVSLRNLFSFCNEVILEECIPNICKKSPQNWYLLSYVLPDILLQMIMSVCSIC